MADPAVVACPKDVWTKVASAVTTGQIWILNTKPNVYRQTYRVAGNPAPVGSVPEEKAFQGEVMQISAGVAIDVYLFPVGKDGSVRVDL